MLSSLLQTLLHLPRVPPHCLDPTLPLLQLSLMSQIQQMRRHLLHTLLKKSKPFSSSGSPNTNGWASRLTISCTVTIVLNTTKQVHLCTNQHSTLTRHVLSKEHQSCINVPALHRDLELSQVKVNSRQDKAAMVMFKATHWVAGPGGCPTVQV